MEKTLEEKKTMRLNQLQITYEQTTFLPQMNY